MPDCTPAMVMLKCLPHQRSPGTLLTTEPTTKQHLQGLQCRAPRSVHHIALLGRSVSPIFTAWHFSLLKETAFSLPAFSLHPLGLFRLGSVPVRSVAHRSPRIFLCPLYREQMISRRGLVLIHGVTTHQKEMLVRVHHGGVLAKHWGFLLVPAYFPDSS